MTKTEKYIILRKQGMSYDAIAKMCGVSKQAVHSSIRKHTAASINVKPTTVVFPGLRQWMTNNHVFVVDLEHMTGRSLRRALNTGRISAQSIDAIMQATGLSYEQAFGRVGRDE